MNSTLPNQVTSIDEYHVHPPVEFRRLPFFDHLAYLLNPSSLVPQNNKQMQEGTFYFHLTSQQATDVLSSLEDQTDDNSENNKKQIQLRLCVLDTSCEQDDFFPPQVVVKINSKLIPLAKPIPTNKPGVEPKRPPRPVNITQYVKLSPTVANTITVSWAADYGRGYAISVALVHKLTSFDLLQRLKNNGARNADHTRASIKEKLSNDGDCEIATTSLRVSLMCPLGKMRMMTPCRAITCNHLQCFDALLFIQMNEKDATWQCPICDKPSLYDNLMIDGYFEEVLSSPLLPLECQEILLNKDGSWSVQPPENIILSDNSTTYTNNRTNVIQRQNNNANISKSSSKEKPIENENKLSESSVVSSSDPEDNIPLAKLRLIDLKSATLPKREKEASSKSETIEDEQKEPNKLLVKCKKTKNRTRRKQANERNRTYKETFKNESAEHRKIRLEKQRMRQRKRREEENEEQRRQRLEYSRQHIQMRRKKESEEERNRRLEYSKLQVQKRRNGESEDERKLRSTYSKRQMQKRKNEESGTWSQLELWNDISVILGSEVEKLRKIKQENGNESYVEEKNETNEADEENKKLKERFKNESPEHRRIRLEKQRMRQRRKREEENEEQRLRRLEYAKLHIQKRRSEENEEERRRRLEYSKVQSQKRRDEESEEERKRRLEDAKQRQQLRRNRLCQDEKIRRLAYSKQQMQERINDENGTWSPLELWNDISVILGTEVEKLRKNKQQNGNSYCHDGLEHEHQSVSVNDSTLKIKPPKVE